jgi:hypothetical protein
MVLTRNNIFRYVNIIKLKYNNIMRKTTIFLAFMALSMSLCAMSEEITTNGFIFPEYQKGKVYFKNKQVVEALLNYEMISKQMLFKQNDQILSLGLPETTDSVVISGRVFVFYENVEFFEKIPVGKGSLYIQTNSTMVIDGREAGFGGYSQVSNTKSISTLSSSTGDVLTHLSAKEQYKAKIDLAFWIKHGKNFVRISTKSQTLKAFSKHKKSVQSYLDTHKVNFGLLNDVTELLTYCYSLQ